MKVLQLLISASIVAAHGSVKEFVIDGTTYPGYLAPVDGTFGTKRIVWAFPEQDYAGNGPVKDVLSPDITCRKNPQPPALIAEARAGAKVKFQWTDYFVDHKGPVMTYMGPMTSPTMKPQTVRFFKVHENAYDPATKVWGTDALIRQNSSMTVTIPSDIKPGLYMMRHEILSLHFVNRTFGPFVQDGPQFYPVCININITGSGSAEPQGVTFPGGYDPKDPGITTNSYNGVKDYTAPGPKVYQGKYEPPQGTAPVVKNTGADNNPQEKALYDTITGLWSDVVTTLNNFLQFSGMDGVDKPTPLSAAPAGKSRRVVLRIRGSSR